MYPINVDFLFSSRTRMQTVKVSELPGSLISGFFISGRIGERFHRSPNPVQIIQNGFELEPDHFGPKPSRRVSMVPTGKAKRDSRQNTTQQKKRGGKRKRYAWRHKIRMFGDARCERIIGATVHANMAKEGPRGERGMTAAADSCRNSYQLLLPLVPLSCLPWLSR